MSRVRAEISDIPLLILKITTENAVKSGKRTTCTNCGCLIFPADPSCPGCKDIVLRRMNNTR